MCGRRGTLLYVTTLGMLLIILGARAEEPVAGNSVALRMSHVLSSPKATYLVGEPLVLNVSIRNDGQERIALRLHTELESNTGITLWVLRPLQVEWKAELLYGGTREASPMESLATGYALPVRGVILTRNGDEPAETPLFLDIPGRYQFKIIHTYRSPNEPPDELDAPVKNRPTFESNVVSVDVREPENDDAAALALWKQGLKANGWLSLGSDLHDPYLAELIATYPNSIYTLWGKFQFAQEVRTTPLGQEGPPSPEEIRASLLEDVVRVGYDVFPLWPKAALCLAELYALAHREADAQTMAQMVQTEALDSPEMAEAGKLLEQWADDAKERATVAGDVLR